jgi:hypothetical protein
VSLYLTYYYEAFKRCALAAWDWATGQGLYLTWMIAVGVVISAVLYAVMRAVRKHHTWEDAFGNIRKSVEEFIFVVFAGTFIALVLLFFTFFVRDAPERLAAEQAAVSTLRADNLRALADLEGKDSLLAIEHEKAMRRLEAEKQNDINRLNAEISELKIKLDDREAQRRERLEQIRIREERINAVAGAIATGNGIAKVFEEKNDKELIVQQYRVWEEDVLNMLSAKFGVAYLAQFGSARSTGMTLLNHNFEGAGWYSLLQGKLIVLNGILLELRRQ